MQKFVKIICVLLRSDLNPAFLSQPAKDGVKTRPYIPSVGRRAEIPRYVPSHRRGDLHVMCNLFTTGIIGLHRDIILSEMAED